MSIRIPGLCFTIALLVSAPFSESKAQAGGAGIICIHPTQKEWEPSGVCPNREYFASVGADSLTAPGFLFVPDEKPVSFVLVLVEGGLVGHIAFDSRIWRAMCVRLSCAMLHFSPGTSRQIREPSDDPGRNARSGSGKLLLALLDTLGRRSGHPELSKVPLAMWGFSATGNFTMTFPPLAPGRVFASIRVHSNLRGLAIDTTAMRRIPTLMLAGEFDSVAGIEDAQKLWARGRELDAPWALAIEPHREHVSLDSWYFSSELVWRWIGAFRPGGSVAPISTSKPWLGDLKTSAVFPEAAFQGDRKSANWFPDSVTADAWRRLRTAPRR